MHIEPLVKMANEIAAFFVSGNDEDEAARLIADHLRRFWEPRMRKALIAHWQAGGEGLKPAVMKAVGLLSTPAASARV
jgi:formate dehydrogenase subunit delta